MRAGFGCTALPSSVHATLFGHGNPCRLPFLTIFHLDFREPEKDTGHHAAYRAAQIDLLRDDDDSYVPLTPVCQQGDPFVLPSREPIEFPDHDGGDRPVKDGPLQLFKRRTPERHTRLNVFKPLHRRELDPLTREPSGEFRFLTVGLLPSG